MPLPAKPFPQTLSYPDCIHPGSAEQRKAMNQRVQEFYTYFRHRYFKASNGVTPGGGYYFDRPDTFQGGTYKTISEAHGYGMIVLALMAGFDAEAQEYFDGFYNFYDQHRSRSNPHLMTWVVPEDEGPLANDSATDGDMDIAYALLLAHTQWGSDGRVNYLAQARRIITEGIKAANLGPDGRTLLGDWDKDGKNSRPSDWMTGHFQAFYQATGDAAWLKTRTRCFQLIESLVQQHAPHTGLVPDFVVGDPPRPAPPHFLERDFDSAYSWNACRVPLRLAVDFAHYGSPESRRALQRIASWLRRATLGDPSRVHHGYALSGEPLPIEVQFPEASRMIFMAPFLSGCIADGGASDYLTRGWELLGQPAGYYADCLDLLSMLLISGNWWAPET